MKIPRMIRRELERTGLDWSLEPGANHIKINLAGHMVGILPRTENINGRGAINVRAQIRRAARRIKENNNVHRPAS